MKKSVSLKYCKLSFLYFCISSYNKYYNKNNKRRGRGNNKLLYSCMLTKLCKMYCHWSELTKFTFFVHVSSTAHQQPRKLSGSHDCRTAVFRDSCQIWKVLSSWTSTYSWCSGLSNFVSYNLLVLKLRYIFESLAP